MLRANLETSRASKALLSTSYDGNMRFCVHPLGSYRLCNEVVFEEDVAVHLSRCGAPSELVILSNYALLRLYRLLNFHLFYTLPGSFNFCLDGIKLCLLYGMLLLHLSRMNSLAISRLNVFLLRVLWASSFRCFLCDLSLLTDHHHVNFEVFRLQISFPSVLVVYLLFKNSLFLKEHFYHIT